MSARYAVYFAPDKTSAWWAFGAYWLGRNEFDNTALPQPAFTDISPIELNRLTNEPRRYGFHATLKAPFRLATGHDETGLIKRLNALADQLTPVALGTMRVATLGNFVALIPALNPDGLEALAAACVTELDDLRAPLLETDLIRRRVETLDARALELLARYGYPHVLERFRLHLTLANPVVATQAQRVTSALTAQVDQLNKESPLLLDRLCLFVEPAPGEPFQRIADVALRA